MEQTVCSIYDSKAEIFGRPFVTPTKASALRLFGQLVNDQQSEFAKFPGDYTLFVVGKFDDATGLVTPTSTPISLGLGVEVKEVK